MRDTYGNANTRLRTLAEAATGLRYDSEEAQAILGQADWQSHWPVVDADGELTGDVVETDDCDEYANVADETMISLSDLSDAQRREADRTGYAPI